MCTHIHLWPYQVAPLVPVEPRCVFLDAIMDTQRWYCSSWYNLCGVENVDQPSRVPIPRADRATNVASEGRTVTFRRINVPTPIETTSSRGILLCSLME